MISHPDFLTQSSAGKGGDPAGIEFRQESATAFRSSGGCFEPAQGEEITPELQVETPEGELHLRFYLPSGNELALSATGIREVMQKDPNQISPVPNASPLLLGTINLRGQVIWVADLGRFLGDKRALKTERAEMPIIAIEDQATILGLAIDGLGDMEWLDIEELQQPNAIADHIAPYVQGEWVMEQNQLLRLLDYAAVLHSSRWTE